jgi:hypothetical protein
MKPLIIFLLTIAIILCWSGLLDWWGSWKENESETKRTKDESEDS